MAHADFAFSSAGNDSAGNSLGNEFAGLSLHPHSERGRNQFTIEFLALAAISALKEEALRDYNAPLLDYDFTDHLHPENPVRITMWAEMRAEKTKRSTVMWAINHIVPIMMQTQYLHALTFTVYYFAEHLYAGFVTVKQSAAALDTSTNQSSIATKALGHPTSLIRTPTNSTNVVLNSSSPLMDDPHYYLSIDYIQSRASVLPEIRIFQTLLALLLQLGKSDAASIQPRVGIESPGLLAWVFMVSTNIEGFGFQQFQAVAIVEAIARHDVLHNQFRETTFQLLEDGHSLAKGCVTQPAVYRRWCRGMFQGDVLAPSDGVDHVAATK